jgi:hypothetical protein
LTLAGGRVCPGVSGDIGGGRGEHDTVVDLVRGAGAAAAAAAATTVVVLEGGGGSVSAIEEVGGWVRISSVEQMRGATLPDLPIRYFSPPQQQRLKRTPLENLSSSSPQNEHLLLCCYCFQVNPLRPQGSF